MVDEIFIQEQLERLPTKIGGFLRRFANINALFTIQYSTNGFYFQNNTLKFSIPTDNDVLYSESGNNLEEIINEILAKIEIDRRLEKIDKHSQPFVYINNILTDQGITKISLIKPTGALTMIAPCVPLLPSWSQNYFIVQTEDYLLAFGRKGNSYFFKRNDICVNLPIPSKAITANEITLAIVWNLNEIGISGYLGSQEKKETKPKWEARYHDWKKSVPTLPPNSLYVWARKQLLISKKNYLRPGQVFNVVIEALRTLNEEISITNDLGAFWDEQRNGKKIVKLIPKREPVLLQSILKAAFEILPYKIT